MVSGRQVRHLLPLGRLQRPGLRERVVSQKHVQQGRRRSTTTTSPCTATLLANGPSTTSCPGPTTRAASSCSLRRSWSAMGATGMPNAWAKIFVDAGRRRARAPTPQQASGRVGGTSSPLRDPDADEVFGRRVDHRQRSNRSGYDGPCVSCHFLRFERVTSLHLGAVLGAVLVLGTSACGSSGSSGSGSGGNGQGGTSTGGTGTRRHQHRRHGRPRQRHRRNRQRGQGAGGGVARRRAAARWRGGKGTGGTSTGGATGTGGGASAARPAGQPVHRGRSVRVPAGRREGRRDPRSADRIRRRRLVHAGRDIRAGERGAPAARSTPRRRPCGTAARPTPRRATRPGGSRSPR